MNILNLQITDPGLYIEQTTPTELLVAIRNLDSWGEKELKTVNRMVSVWSARAIANPNDREGISELQRLIHFTINRAQASSNLPEEYRYRWLEASDMLEARRLNLAHADPEAQLGRKHVKKILNLLLKAENRELPQSALAQHLGDLTSGRITQLVGPLEANGLISKRKDGRDNLLKLTETGLSYAKNLYQKKGVETIRGASFLVS